MQTTLTIDKGLLNRASDLTGVTDTSSLVNAGLKMFIERVSARRLARLGGSEPNAGAPPRQRPTD